MALILEHVSHTYGRGTAFAVDALIDVSLSVEPGRLTVVLGPTGSGKSTLLGIASGLLAPTSGSVVLDGTPAEGVLAGRAGGVGLVFQAPETQLFAESVLDDVAFGPVNLGLPRSEALDRAKEALVTVGLEPEEFADRSPFALSGGEARRVALAGVLAMRPAYLLLDEPTAGLDARGREAVLSVLREIVPTTGVAIVTHDADEFLALADDALVLSRGRSLYWGPVEGLVRDPEPLDRSGLIVPEVVRALHDARDAGIAVEPVTADPVRAAALLAAALGGEGA